MAEKGTIEVSGLKELAKRLAEIDEAIQKRIGRSGTNAAAQVIRRRAIANVKAQSTRTGTLAKSIIIKYIMPSESRHDSEHIVTVRGRGKKGKTLPVAWYAHFVEFGTVTMPAEPFLRPAFDAGKEEAISALKAKLTDRLNKENHK